MCNITDGFKLCTCATLNENDATWVLKRHDPLSPLRMTIGEWIEPQLQEEDLKEWVLAELNKRNCFDFEYQPKQNDLLCICINKELDIWGYFRHKSKTWTEDKDSPFENWKQRLAHYKHGIIQS